MSHKVADTFFSVFLVLIALFAASVLISLVGLVNDITSEGNKEEAMAPQSLTEEDLEEVETDYTRFKYTSVGTLDFGGVRMFLIQDLVTGFEYLLASKGNQGGLAFIKIDTL